MDKHKLKKLKITSGFTIIEVIVVVVVIGILASVTTLAGRAYIQRSDEAAVQSTLTTAAAAMKQAYDKEGSYPSTLPAALSGSSDILTLSGGGSTYCIEGVKGSIEFYVTQSTATPQQGACPAAPIIPSIAINPTNLNITQDSESRGSGSYAIIANGGTPPYSFSLSGNNVGPRTYYPQANQWQLGVSSTAVLIELIGSGATRSLQVNISCPIGNNISFSTPNPLEITVTDSNNQSVSASLSLTMIPYTSPGPFQIPPTCPV